MLDFTLTQRGQLPDADTMGQALVAVEQRAVTILLDQVTRNVSGGVVNVRSGRLRAGIVAKITALDQGAVTATVGFDKRVAFIARFLERGTKPHELGRGARTTRAAFGRRKAQRARGPFRGKRGGILRFRAGGEIIFRRSAHHPGLKPRPILEKAVEAAVPLIQADGTTIVDKVLNG